MDLRWPKFTSTQGYVCRSCAGMGCEKVECGEEQLKTLFAGLDLKGKDLPEAMHPVYVRPERARRKSRKTGLREDVVRFFGICTHCEERVGVVSGKQVTDEERVQLLEALERLDPPQLALECV